jgi:hypothetical protein
MKRKRQDATTKRKHAAELTVDVMGCTSRFCCINNDRVATASKDAATSTEDVATSVCCIAAAVQTETVGDKEDAKYEVEKIMRREYLLKWEDYPNEDNSWVDTDHLSCPDLVKEYEERLDTGDVRQRRDRPVGINDTVLGQVSS